MRAIRNRDRVLHARVDANGGPGIRFGHALMLNNQLDVVPRTKRRIDDAHLPDPGGQDAALVLEHQPAHALDLH